MSTECSVRVCAHFCRLFLCRLSDTLGLLPWLALRREWIVAAERRLAESASDEWRSYVKCPVESQFPIPAYAMYALGVIDLAATTCVFFFL